MLAVGESRPPSPTTLSSLTVEPHDLCPCPVITKGTITWASHIFTLPILLTTDISLVTGHKSEELRQASDALTLALDFWLSAFSSCRLRTDGRTVCLTRLRVCVEAVIPRSVTMAATIWDFQIANPLKVGHIHNHIHYNMQWHVYCNS